MPLNVSTTYNAVTQSQANRKFIKRSLGIHVLLASLLLAACGHADLAKEAPLEAAIQSSPSEQDHSEWTEGVLAWRTPTFEQSYGASNFSFVTFTDRQLNSGTGEWSERTVAGSTAFDIVRIASARRDLFCVAGLTQSGSLVLERWELIPVMVTVSLPEGGTATTAALDGNGMVIKRLAKTELYRGPLATEIHGLDYDDDDRFILCLTSHSGLYALYRFESSSFSTPVALLDSGTLPELAQMSFLSKHDHTLLGRVWRLDDNLIFSVRILFIDSDNDGAFDGSPVVGDRAFYATTGLDEYEQWDSLTSP